MAPKLLPSFGLQPKAKGRPTLGGKGVVGGGAKSGFGGKGLGKGGLKRHRYVAGGTVWRLCDLGDCERRGGGGEKQRSTHASHINLALSFRHLHGGT